MRIYACGCSFTHGDELEDRNKAWTTQLAKLLDSTVDNHAASGGSNHRTVYHTIKNLTNYNYYFISWTDYSRYTFYKSDNNHETNFNINLSHGLYGKEKFYRSWGAELYHTWYNELFAFKLWLQQIIQLQHTLKDKSYLMINAMPNNLKLWTAPREKFIDSVKNLITFDLMTDEQIFDEYNEIQYYINLIDTSKFYRWNEFHIAELCDRFPCGPGGHILEQGHEHLANLIYQHLCSK